MKSKAKAVATATKNATTIPSDFWVAIARTAVSQICQSVGFKATQLAALETLTLVATKYLQAIAHSAASLACHSGRTQSNLLDLTRALHEIISLHSGGLSGGSILHKDSSPLLLTSGVLKDLARFVKFHDEIPFAKPIPRRNHSTPVDSTPPMHESDHQPHVPKWLPRFPERKWVDAGRRGKEKRAREERLWEESVTLGDDGCGERKWELGNYNHGKRAEVKEHKAELGVADRRRVRFRIRGDDGLCREAC